MHQTLISKLTMFMTIRMAKTDTNSSQHDVCISLDLASQSLYLKRQKYFMIKDIICYNLPSGKYLNILISVTLCTTGAPKASTNRNQN